MPRADDNFRLVRFTCPRAATARNHHWLPIRLAVLFNGVVENRCRKEGFMRITSTAFRNGGHIPHQYSHYGQDKTPPLHIEDVPADARSLLLIMDDPDAPKGLFTHWVVFNLDPKSVDLGEGLPEEARQGRNSWGESGYGGPRPPSGEHRYFFRLHALDVHLDLPSGAARNEIEEAMTGHVVAQAELMGRFAAETEPAGTTQ